jgi:hypothetical protein
MRSLIIRYLVPLLLCLLPLAAGVFLVAATPRTALDFYLERIAESPLDWFILGLGGALFVFQLALAFRGLRWQERGFDQRPDGMMLALYGSSEWFPLLGLLGTVIGILQTFSVVGSQEVVAQREIIRLYAPALTTTASGLLMAFLNVMPSWLVTLGRRLILSMAVTPTAEA